jgi:COP9 signalosome complex subunit 2
MYKLILGNLKAGNQRLWFSTSLRLGKIYLDEKEFDQLEKLILELKEPCRDANNPVLFDISKGNFLLEVFALEIQMCIERKEQRRMKEVFALTEKFSSVIEDNRVKIIIQECGGKMFMTEKKWDSALKSFKGCFEAMAETGHLRAPTLLKYVILT